MAIAQSYFLCMSYWCVTVRWSNATIFFEISEEAADVDHDIRTQATKIVNNLFRNLDLLTTAQAWTPLFNSFNSDKANIIVVVVRTAMRARTTSDLDYFKQCMIPAVDEMHQDLLVAHKPITDDCLKVFSRMFRVPVSSSMGCTMYRFWS